MPEVSVFISQEVTFHLAGDEWFERDDFLVVQVRVTIIHGSSSDPRITTFAILPTDIEKYRKGGYGPRNYKHPSLTEDEQAQYIAQARATIEAELKAKA